jgi:hydroxymethylglutaryl-CoA lyase
MQGWHRMIPAKEKINYLNALLKVGFDTIDFGSFVSAKAIPQMADTREVIENLETETAKSKLLAIVANTRGAEEALCFNSINYLGFPFSISPTFQRKNTNSTIEESLKTVESIQDLCKDKNKELVVYLSMAFGNPYGDPYNEQLLIQWATALTDRGISILSLADTVGLATPAQIDTALCTLIPAFPETSIGVHLHSSSVNSEAKLAAALNAGCNRFDGALKGIGGCPMAQNELIGNMDSSLMIRFFEEKGLDSNIDRQALADCLKLADEIFV